MNKGRLVRHKLSERGMTGIVVDRGPQPTELIVLWDDGRKSTVLKKFLSNVPLWG